MKLEIHEQYRNMAEKIKPCMHLIDHAKEVMKELGLTPDVSPVRGGTDGARLSFMGLPCPNLGTGGYAFHGPYEHITVEGMDLSVKIILGIIFLIDCIALTIVVLMQEGKQQGLGSIAGVADTYWGKNKGRSMEGGLIRGTIIMGIIFFVLSIVLNII